MSRHMTRTAGIFLRPRPQSFITPQSRLASSNSHHDEHHGEQHVEDSVSYSKEDFSSPVWRNFVLLGLAAAGFYKLAPAPGDDTYLTRFIAHYSTPRDVWENIRFKHLLLTVEGSDDTLLVADAKRPPIHRYRYPQRLEQSSPHLHPVGSTVDVSDVVVKNDGA
ncbi:uncharacterized protein FIBRA_02434 [Fibroporia radiculosa]|uniref:Uncharacterized protein n=1 Tax=Fibroporia radiculosa TaxID=599839 RepID=J4H1U9_9APHY|nr:uncharacterized protein FIBRA_02434 [Fibroporia radiculosa]CCM00404.1 predicted protein [Fibroporia radiculosa]